MDCNLFNTAMVSYWKCLENWGVHLTQRSFQLSPPFPPPPPFYFSKLFISSTEASGGPGIWLSYFCLL